MKHTTEETPNNTGLRKDDLKNVNKLVAKTVSKSKAFVHLKQQANKDKKSTGGKKVNKLLKSAVWRVSSFCLSNRQLESIA